MSSSRRRPPAEPALEPVVSPDAAAPPTSDRSHGSEPASRTSLYVHVPFCVVKCGYCDFTSYVVEGPEPLDRYLAALDRELRLAAPPRQPYTVFLGGGTPTYLDEVRFERLFEILRRHVDLAACDEVTIEANPESVTPAKARAALAAGVSRVSMGAQTFDARHLRFLDRAHDAERTRRAFATWREAGCTNLSLDLIFGLPGQTPAEQERDLEQALALAPDHLSCYGLTFEPGTRLGRDLQQGRVQPLDDRLERDMFVRTRERLREAGFVAYEISNFAGRGGPCRHNDHYWLQGDYVGVGPGAASHRSGVRSTNLKALAAWTAAAERGLPPTATAETLDRCERAAEALWLGLRRTEGVDLDAVERRLAFPVRREFGDAIDQLVAMGLTGADRGRLQLTDHGLLFANSATERLLAAAGEVRRRRAERRTQRGRRSGGAT